MFQFTPFFTVLAISAGLFLLTKAILAKKLEFSAGEYSVVWAWAGGILGAILGGGTYLLSGPLLRHPVLCAVLVCILLVPAHVTFALKHMSRRGLYLSGGMTGQSRSFAYPLDLGDAFLVGLLLLVTCLAGGTPGPTAIAVTGGLYALAGLLGACYVEAEIHTLWRNRMSVRKAGQGIEITFASSGGGGSASILDENWLRLWVLLDGLVVGLAYLGVPALFVLVGRTGVARWAVFIACAAAALFPHPVGKFARSLILRRVRRDWATATAAAESHDIDRLVSFLDNPPLYNAVSDALEEQIDADPAAFERVAAAVTRGTVREPRALSPLFDAACSYSGGDVLVDPRLGARLLDLVLVPAIPVALRAHLLHCIVDVVKRGTTAEFVRAFETALPRLKDDAHLMATLSDNYRWELA